MGFLSWLGSSNESNTNLEEIYPFKTLEAEFVRCDVVNIYSRILTDTVERTQGIPQDVKKYLWDNCLGSENQDGLITMLAVAMEQKSDLCLVYKKEVSFLRIATPQEKEKIKQDYQKQGSSSLGVYVTFQKFGKSDMVKIYSCLEYSALKSLYKSMKLSSAIQMKLSKLRELVSLNDKGDAATQAQAMAKGLAKGQDIMMDSEDIIETAKPDLTAAKAAMEFIDQKRSLYLGMPASYITGIQNGGLGDSGQADSKAIERGLKSYHVSVVKPVMEALFNLKNLDFESENYDQLSTNLEALKTFELVSDELISQKNKLLVVNRLFGFPEDTKGDPPKEVKDVTPPPDDPKKLPAPGQPPPAKPPAV